MLSHWQRAHSEHNKATMMKINCRVSGLLHLYFEARCDKGPRFFVQKFLVFEGNRMRKPEKERETTRSSKQCEFCNYVRDKSLISQGCQSGSISPDGQGGPGFQCGQSGQGGTGGLGDPGGRGCQCGPGGPG